MIEEKMIELKRAVIDQANIIENMLNEFIRGFEDNNSELLKHLIALKNQIIENEIKIDEFCTRIFALYSPEAKDLRTVLMISRMNIDLEKMGDYCISLAKSAIFLFNHPVIIHSSVIPLMLIKVKKMVFDSIQAFIDNNEELAKQVCTHDHEVDSLNQQLYEELLTLMENKSRQLECYLHLIRIGNNIEKLANLTINISDGVAYITSGRKSKQQRLSNTITA
ncbi:MAG: hypothetical protein MJB14_09045 [Spirochaetes bacterium]|nr:hypothetical protein [Spirochaetota bacterium]